MGIRLGGKSKEFDIYLPRDAGWQAALRRQSGPFPDDAELTIEFQAIDDEDPPIWSATLVEDVATWSQSKASVQEIFDANYRAADLMYTEDGGVPIQWGNIIVWEDE
jgi:hypothetical protein